MKAVIVAAGGLGRTVADILARTENHRAVGFCDDHADPAAPMADLPVLGTIDQLGDAAARTGAEGAVIAVGDPTIRKELAAKAKAAGLALPIITDPTAVVSPSAHLAEGVVIGPNATVGPEARIGRLAIIGAAAVVEHNAAVQEAAYVGPRCLIDARATVAANVVVKNGRCVAQDAVVNES